MRTGQSSPEKIGKKHLGEIAVQLRKADFSDWYPALTKIGKLKVAWDEAKITGIGVALTSVVKRKDVPESAHKIHLALLVRWSEEKGKAGATDSGSADTLQHPMSQSVSGETPERPVSQSASRQELSMSQRAFRLSA